MKEVPRIRKGYLIHFISRDEYETVIETNKPDNPFEGTIKTNKNEYSVDFIQRWRVFGFLKIYRQ